MKNGVKHGMGGGLKHRNVPPSLKPSLLKFSSTPSAEGCLFPGQGLLALPHTLAPPGAGPGQPKCERLS